MFSKLAFRGGRRLVLPCSQRLSAASISEDIHSKTDPWETLAKSNKESSLQHKHSEKINEINEETNVLEENKLSELRFAVTGDAPVKGKTLSTELTGVSRPPLNTELIAKHFRTISVSQVCDIMNSDLQSCTPETLAEIEDYLDAVDKLDPHSTDWDSMTSFLPHPDEDRGIRYNFLKPKSSSFEDYIEHSETLQKLVMMGVDLSAVQEFPFIGNYIIRLDFERDIIPKLLFLKDLGVYDHNLGLVLTTNPYILEDPINKLQPVVGYLKSKKFTDEMIGKMVTRHAMFLIMEVGQIDSKLGMFQKMFRLKGDQMREIFSIYPVLISHNRKKIQDVHFLLHKIWGFDHNQLQAMFLKCPLIFAEEAKTTLQTRLENLYDMQVSMDTIAENPGVLLGDHHQVRRRHAFLKEMGRAHYNPEKAGYVSLETLAKSSTDKWCWKIGVPKEYYFTFLKTE